MNYAGGFCKSVDKIDNKSINELYGTPYNSYPSQPFAKNCITKCRITLHTIAINVLCVITIVDMTTTDGGYCVVCGGESTGGIQEIKQQYT